MPGKRNSQIRRLFLSVTLSEQWDTYSRVIPPSAITCCYYVRGRRLCPCRSRTSCWDRPGRDDHDVRTAVMHVDTPRRRAAPGR